MQLKQLGGLSPSLSSPLPSLVPPNITRDALYRTHCASAQEPFPLIVDLQGHPAKSGNKHRATLQETLASCAVWHPSLLLGWALVARLCPCPVAAGGCSLIKQGAVAAELESRWREGEQQLDARWSPGSPALCFVNAPSA